MPSNIVYDKNNVFADFLQTVDGKTVFEGNNRYYDQALCTGLNITDEDIDALCKAMKEQAVPKRSFLLYGQKRPNMV